MGKNGIKERQYFMRKNLYFESSITVFRLAVFRVGHMKVLLLMLKMVF